MRAWLAMVGVGLVAAGCGEGDERRVTLESDDLVLVGGMARVRLSSSFEGQVTLRSRGAGAVDFEPSRVDLVDGATVDVVITGTVASAIEADTDVEVVVDGRVVATQPITVVTGLALAFEGTFGFAVNNNSGAFAAGMSCGALDDPPIWRATPLPCEQLDATFGRLYLNEVAGKAERWSVASGKRPVIEVLVSEIRSFGPTIDLAGRDPLLDVGTPIVAEQEAAATMFTDNCDEAPTGEPDGSDPGVEPVADVRLSVGEALTIRYADDSDPARVWTTFPAPATPDAIAASAAEVDDVFFPDGATGCSDEVTFLDAMGTLHCDEPHTVAAMMARNAAYRATVEGAWANFTSRSMTTVARNDASPLARIFDAREVFFQLAGYDWFTLTGRVDKGVVSTAGGIPPAFVEWRVSQGCPVPSQPDVVRDAHPLE